jgi:hypothetical protein
VNTPNFSQKADVITSIHHKFTPQEATITVSLKGWKADLYLLMTELKLRPSEEKLAN